MYCVVAKEKEVHEKFTSLEFWTKLIGELLKRSDELGIGDEKDRQDALAQNFRLPTEEGTVEMFDGINHEESYMLIFVVSLPVLTRGHAI